MPRKTKRTRSIAELAAALPRCRRCPRLRDWCREVARTKRRSYADQDYWGKPVPSFGDARARVWILGLAPAAHGANRTGRMFTGDRSGDFLFAGLHRTGFANQAEAVALDDGLRLRDAYISAAAHCAPPGNKPTRAELEACSGYLDEEFFALERWRVLLCLGGISWTAALGLLQRQGVELGTPKPKFGHGVSVDLGEERSLVGCYHVSQQNTFTGRLTPRMLDDVLRQARELAGIESK